MPNIVTRGLLIFLLGFAALTPLGSVATAANLVYRLGPGDKVRVRVNEWRPSRGQVYEWDALSGEFTVNVSGAISVPLIGEVPAAGLDTDELANAISQQLQAKVGLVQRPGTSVEIIQYRPFYILGDVSRPGEYAFRPGMTVLQAVGVASGYYRPAESRLQREAITSVGELRVLEVERNALLARKARLESELKGEQTVTFPPSLENQKDRTTVLRFLDQERLIFETRQEALRSHTEALRQVKLVLQKEIASLREKDQVQERQLSLARKELDVVGSLMSKGLTVSTRGLALEQMVAQIESSRLDISLAVVRAEQDMSRADRDILALRNKMRDETSTEMKVTQVRLDEIDRRMETTEDLLAESGTAALRNGTEAIVPVITLIRGSGDAQGQIVSENTAVEPGDTISIRLPLFARRTGDTLGRVPPSTYAPQFSSSETGGVAAR
jgi:exopolysaccharide production protein ExoF